jgi:hypothetical protein
MLSKLIPSFFRVFFIISLFGLFLNLYVQNRFGKTYSKERTELKTKSVSSHGTIYYVNESEHKKVRLLSWITMPLFYLSLIGPIIYKLKTNPQYFRIKRKQVGNKTKA